MNKQEKTALAVAGIVGGIVVFYMLAKRAEAGPPNGNGNGNGGQIYGFTRYRYTEEPLSGAYITCAVGGMVVASTYSAGDGSYSLSGLPFYETITVSIASTGDHWGGTVQIYLTPANSPMKHTLYVTKKT